MVHQFNVSTDDWGSSQDEVEDVDRFKSTVKGTLDYLKERPDLKLNEKFIQLIINIAETPLTYREIRKICKGIEMDPKEIRTKIRKAIQDKEIIEIDRIDEENPLFTTPINTQTDFLEEIDRLNAES